MKFFSSIVIVSACAAWSFFRVRLRRRWWYRRLFLFDAEVVEILVVLVEVLRWIGRVVVELFEPWLGMSSFCLRRLLGPSVMSFFVEIVEVIPGVCCICFPEIGSVYHVCHILF